MSMGRESITLLPTADVGPHPRADRPRRWNVTAAWPLLVLAVWLGLIAAVELVRPPQFTASVCIFRNATGVPCPTCGSTRAVLALMRGDIMQAAAFNPLLIAAIIAGASWLALRSFSRALPQWLRRHPRWLWPIAAIALAANWAYVVWREL